MNNKEKIPWDLLGKHLAGETNKEEKAEINTWLFSDKNNLSIYEEIKRTWNISLPVCKESDINENEAWKNIIKGITPDKKYLPNNRWIKYAAVIIFTICFYWMFDLGVMENEPDYRSYKTEELVQKIILPDESVVILNKKSTLEIPEDFNVDERTVKLIGEAHFSVKHNIAKPFKVVTNLTTAEVLGTSFNYKALKNSKKSKLTVDEGKVKFSLNGNNKNLILVKNYSGEYIKDENKFIRSVVKNENYLAWKTGLLKFKEQSVGEIVKHLSAFYNVEFIIENKKLYEIKLTISFDNLKLEETIKLIEMTAGIKTQINGKQIILN